MTESPNADAVTPKDFPWLQPQEAVEILDSGRAYNGGNAPATIRYGGHDLPNERQNAAPQSYLGREQKAWLLERLRTSRVPWKLWGHSFGTLAWRTDVQNLPAELKASWPGAGYGLFNGGFYAEHAELLDFVREHGITGLALVAGDKHSFWAGRVSKSLPPEKFEPLAVEFVTGSISAPGLFESAEYNLKREHPLHALYLQKGADGSLAPAMNMTMLHGVRAALTLEKTKDVTAALKESNPDVAPHLSFADLSGHGYATVRVSARELETEFVCIPRPLEKSSQPDGGPLAYRVVHRVPLWSAGQAPRLEQKIVEGVPPLAMR
jgi:alkaline phosphatase D